jgi:hypothetical protein
MTPDEALAVVQAACSRALMTLDDHRHTQAALGVLNDALHPAPPRSELVPKLDGEVADGAPGV